MLAESTFKPFADASGAAFDGSIAEGDAERLRAATAGVVALVDSTIAHDDKQIPTIRSTFDELDAAVVLIAELTKKYTLLLTGASFPTMTPIDQTNATRVFRFPWIDAQHLPNLSDHRS